MHLRSGSCQRKGVFSCWKTEVFPASFLCLWKTLFWWNTPQFTHSSRHLWLSRAGVVALFSSHICEAAECGIAPQRDAWLMGFTRCLCSEVGPGSSWLEPVSVGLRLCWGCWVNANWRVWNCLCHSNGRVGRTKYLKWCFEGRLLGFVLYLRSMGKSQWQDFFSAIQETFFCASGVLFGGITFSMGEKLLSSSSSVWATVFRIGC